MNTPSADQHPFITAPRKTLMKFVIPIVLSLIAEPITGIVDTAFIAQLGADAMAGLGIGATLLSTTLWVFGFLSVSAQTEVSQALGAGQPDRARAVNSLALILGAILSLMLVVLGVIGADFASELLGAEGAVKVASVEYITIRLISLPAILLTIICIGVMRGLQDMRRPFYAAIIINVLNIVLDAAFVPTMGVAGAAWASVFSQWVGAAYALNVIIRRLGFVLHVDIGDALRLLKVGGDLFVRTALLTAYVLFTTRIANQISSEAGAANQAIRTIYLFTVYLIDGFGVSAQSLVGYFLGAKRPDISRAAAGLALRWGVGLGLVLTAILALITELVINLLVPVEAVAAFRSAWLSMAILPPIAAAAFITDGVHWGTGDYVFVRNAMIVSAIVTFGMTFLIDVNAPNALSMLWLTYIPLLGVRAVIGVLRIWPGFGKSPLRRGYNPAV